MPGPMPPMGMPGMMPPPLPGMMPGGPPQGAPNPAIQALQGLSGAPPATKWKEAIASAEAHTQLAMAEVSLRSAKAAEHFSKAYQELQKGRQVMEQLASEPVGPPPDLLGGLTPMAQGAPSPLM